MNNWYNGHMNHFSVMMCEDVCAPELRNPSNSAIRSNGWLKRLSTLQFFDPEAGIFLNGRQVQGHCPVQGCKSEKAYADECDLGHQFEPEDLLGPKSSVTGCVP